MFWKHKFDFGVTDIDFSQETNSEKTLLVSTLKSKFHLCNLLQVEELNLPLKASLSTMTRPDAVATNWCARFSPHSPDNLAVTTNDGHIILYKLVSQFIFVKNKKLTKLAARKRYSNLLKK